MQVMKFLFVEEWTFRSSGKSAKWKMFLQQLLPRTNCFSLGFMMRHFILKWDGVSRSISDCPWIFQLDIRWTCLPSISPMSKFGEDSPKDHPSKQFQGYSWVPWNQHVYAMWLLTYIVTGGDIQFCSVFLNLKSLSSSFQTNFHVKKEHFNNKSPKSSPSQTNLPLKKRITFTKNNPG